MVDVPWNASWSSEDRYEVRPCRWVKGQLAIWSPHNPGVGRPIFAKPHMVRQRKSIALMLCTVCGEPTRHGDRWWFGLGRVEEDYFLTTEAPVHQACAAIATQKCPHIQRNGLAPMPFPDVRYSILQAIVGGAKCEEDFLVKIAGRRVIGHLKIGWPKSLVPLLGVIGVSVDFKASTG